MDEWRSCTADVDCCLATRLPEDFFRRSSNTWLNWYCPSSRFMVVPCFLIAIVSLIQRLYRSLSLPMILASSQSIRWLLSTTWSDILPIYGPQIEKIYEWLLFWCPWKTSFLPQHDVPPDACQTSYQFHQCRTPDSFYKRRSKSVVLRGSVWVFRMDNCVLFIHSAYTPCMLQPI